MGMAGVLIATALHLGTVTSCDIATLLNPGTQ
jgi:uncharacterized protein related to proFAR isomerase